MEEIFLKTNTNYGFKTVQSISSPSPYFSDNHSFAFLKCSLPMNPLRAESGEGWADLRRVQTARQETSMKTYWRTKCLVWWSVNSGLEHNWQKLTSSIPIALHVFCAGRPQTMNTTPRSSPPSFMARLTTARRTSAVNFSHPCLECELALWARTVRQAFSQSTPCSAIWVKSLVNWREHFKKNRPDRLTPILVL